MLALMPKSSSQYLNVDHFLGFKIQSFQPSNPLHTEDRVATLISENAVSGVVCDGVSAPYSGSPDLFYNSSGLTNTDWKITSGAQASLSLLLGLCDNQDGFPIDTLIKGNQRIRSSQEQMGYDLEDSGNLGGTVAVAFRINENLLHLSQIGDALYIVELNDGQFILSGNQVFNKDTILTPIFKELRELKSKDQIQNFWNEYKPILKTFNSLLMNQVNLIGSKEISDFISIVKNCERINMPDFENNPFYEKIKKALKQNMDPNSEKLTFQEKIYLILKAFKEVVDKKLIDLSDGTRLGYGVLSGQENASDFYETRMIPTKNVKRVLIFTDGLINLEDWPKENEPKKRNDFCQKIMSAFDRADGNIVRFYDELTEDIKSVVTETPEVGMISISRW